MKPTGATEKLRSLPREFYTPANLPAMRFSMGKFCGLTCGCGRRRKLSSINCVFVESLGVTRPYGLACDAVVFQPCFGKGCVTPSPYNLPIATESMHSLPELTLNQYSLVYNFLSFTIASMLAGFVFFVLSRPTLAERYRLSMVVSALVVGIAGYHYFRIFNNWTESYRLVGGLGGKYVPTEIPFNDLYRYVDWFLTVPLLMVELVHVMRLERGTRGPLMTKLVVAAALMIALGYPGQNTDSNSARALWGTLSTVPFIYLIFVLWTEVGKTMSHEPRQVAILLRNLRLLTLATWGFYPIAYMAPFFGFTGSGSEVFTQVGYSIADITAKVGYGLMIYAIAKHKSESVETTETAAARRDGARGLPIGQAQTA